MNIQNKSEINWHLVTIVDPTFLKGKSIVDIIGLIRTVVPVKYVTLDYIYGAAEYGLTFTFQEKDAIYEIDKFLENISPVKTFEWGDFFLFTNYPKDWDWGENELYPFVVKQTDTTVRAIDNQYIYIYTPYQEVVDVLEKCYVIESEKVDNLDDLDYPE